MQNWGTNLPEIFDFVIQRLLIYMDIQIKICMLSLGKNSHYKHICPFANYKNTSSSATPWNIWSTTRQIVCMASEHDEVVKHNIQRLLIYMDIEIKICILSFGENSHHKHICPLQITRTHPRQQHHETYGAPQDRLSAWLQSTTKLWNTAGNPLPWTCRFHWQEQANRYDHPSPKLSIVYHISGFNITESMATPASG